MHDISLGKPNCDVASVLHRCRFCPSPLLCGGCWMPAAAGRSCVASAAKRCPSAQLLLVAWAQLSVGALHAQGCSPAAFPSLKGGVGSVAAVHH